MVATQDIPSGAEVYNTYGELDNDSLLRKYGFVGSEPTPFEYVNIDAEEVIDAVDMEARGSDQVREQKALLMERRHVDVIEDGVYLTMPPQAESLALLKVLSVMCGTAEEVSLFNRVPPPVRLCLLSPPNLVLKPPILTHRFRPLILIPTCWYSALRS